MLSPSAQAAEVAERKRQEKQKEQEDNLAEINNLLNSELLLENQQQAGSGAQHVAPYHWKGMSREQLEEIRYVQKQQIQEKLVSPRRATELATSAPLGCPHTQLPWQCSL